MARETYVKGSHQEGRIRKRGSKTGRERIKGEKGS